MSQTPERIPLITPHEAPPLDAGKAHLEVITVGSTIMAHGEFEPGWRWSEQLKSSAGTDSCQVTHTGLVLSGRMMVQMDDGTQVEYGPGDAFFVPPGHDEWVVGDERCVLVDLTGATQYAMPH
ncbi:MAG: cupin [Burkholderia sp.]|jgi:hypothetical protein|nr:cupin [Burkholderia sp.]